MHKNSAFKRRFEDLTRATDYINHLVVRLTELHDQTDPQRGEQSAERKDLAAFMALQLAGKLVDALAGWAINHQVGLAIEGLEFVPFRPAGLNQHHEHIEARAKVDDHRHEITGSKKRDDLGDDLDPVVARRLLMNLLIANPGGFPRNLAVMVRDALEALEFGEVSPLLEPSKSDRKIGLNEQRLQLKAIGLVSYRVAQGFTKRRALEEVAEAFGVSPATIKSWETRLRNELGAIEVEQAIGTARYAVAYDADARKRAQAGDDLAMLGLWEADYDRQALEHAGKRFRASLRDRKKKR